jgi:hypothetical protein
VKVLVEPAPEQVRKTTCQESLTQHWELLVAADFFTVEVCTQKGPQLNASLFCFSSNYLQPRCLTNLNAHFLDIAGIQ